MIEGPLREPESPDDLAELIAAEAPEGEFEVALPGGRTLWFRFPSRYAEVRQFWRTAIEFWQKWSDPDNLLEELKPFAPKDWTEAYAACLIHFWASDKNRFSEKGALTLLRNSWVMDSLKDQIEAAQKLRVQATAIKEVDEAGKGSPQTPSSEKESGSAETPSESTPTS